jgi:hypothetical protein
MEIEEEAPPLRDPEVEKVRIYFASTIILFK